MKKINKSHKTLIKKSAKKYHKSDVRIDFRVSTKKIKEDFFARCKFYGITPSSFLNSFIDFIAYSDQIKKFNPNLPLFNPDQQEPFPSLPKRKNNYISFSIDSKSKSLFFKRCNDLNYNSSNTLRQLVDLFLEETDTSNRDDDYIPHSTAMEFFIDYCNRNHLSAKDEFRKYVRSLIKPELDQHLKKIRKQHK